jgi:hypothetical protein
MNMEKNTRTAATVRPAKLTAALALAFLAAAGAVWSLSRAPSAHAEDKLPPPASGVVAVPDLKLRDGRAILDSAVELKAYYYAYSGVPVDYSAILTADTDNIVAPVPVTATPDQKQKIDALVQAAKAHPEVILAAEEVTFQPYDNAAGAYPVTNRLFVHAAGYYFDNSPFHWTYRQEDEALRKLRCTDAKTRARIDADMASYKQYKAEIQARVVGTDTKAKAVSLAVDKAIFMSGEDVVLSAAP